MTARFIVVAVAAMVMAFGQFSNGFTATAAASDMQVDCSESALMDSAGSSMGSCCENEHLPGNPQDETNSCATACNTICIGAMMVVLDKAPFFMEAMTSPTVAHSLSPSLTPHHVDFITPPPRA